MDERRSGTVASNSRSKHQTSFLLTKDADENGWLTTNIAHDNWTKNLKHATVADHILLVECGGLGTD